MKVCRTEANQRTHKGLALGEKYHLYLSINPTYTIPFQELAVYNSFKTTTVKLHFNKTKCKWEKAPPPKRRKRIKTNTAATTKITGSGHKSTSIAQQHRPI